MPSDPSSSPSSTEESKEAPVGRVSSLYQKLTMYDSALLIGGLLLFLVLLYELERPGSGFLNPVLVAGAGAILLWPIRAHRAVRTLLLAGGFLLFLWFMARISNILIPFVLVYLLAYVLDPVVQGLHRRYGFRRWLSSFLITFLVVGTLVAILLVLIPTVATQVEALAERVINNLRGLQNWLETAPVLDNLAEAGLIDKQEMIQQMTTLIQDQATRLPETMRQLLQSIGSLIGLITILALVPVILFYMLKDYPAIKKNLIELFPTHEGRRDYLIHAGGIVGSYLRGQLLISAIATVNVTFWLLVGGVPFWLLIGLLSGLLNFIPNLGAIITMVIGVLVAFTFGGWVEALIVVVVLLGQGFLEQSILTPNIMSYQVGLHPLLILLSLLVFGAFLGIFGLLIAVPATALLATAYRAYRQELTLELNR